MYLHLGQSVSVPESSILGLFDLDNATWSFRTRYFLRQAEQEGRVRDVGGDLPRSFLLCQQGEEEAEVYLAPVNTATLLRRVEQAGFE